MARFCPIYPSFDRVFALLEETGYEQDFFILEPDEVSYILATTYGNDDGSIQSEKKITDQEEIAAIMQTTAPIVAINYSLLYQRL